MLSSVGDKRKKNKRVVLHLWRQPLVRKGMKDDAELPTLF